VQQPKHAKNTNKRKQKQQTLNLNEAAQRLNKPNRILTPKNTQQQIKSNPRSNKISNPHKLLDNPPKPT